MLNKKALELSLNFIIILIISIIMFGFGIRFMSNLFSQANELKDLTYDQLDEKLGDIVCEGAARVCIPIERKIIQRKNFGVFGVKIINILDGENFEVEVKIPAGTTNDPFGYKKDKTPITIPNPSLIVSPVRRPITINKNEEKTIGVGIQVPANSVSGTYIFNVEITNPSVISQDHLYSSVQKLYVDVP